MECTTERTNIIIARDSQRGKYLVGIADDYQWQRLHGHVSYWLADRVLSGVVDAAISDDDGIHVQMGNRGIYINRTNATDADRIEVTTAIRAGADVTNFIGQDVLAMVSAWLWMYQDESEESSEESSEDWLDVIRASG